MQIEVLMGTTIFSSGRVMKTTTYNAESENEFWDQYVILKNAGNEFKAEIDKLRIVVETFVDADEAYQQEILKAKYRMREEE